MTVLTLRTDNPQAEIGLYDGGRQVAYDSWTAHRELGRTIHARILAMLQANGHDWQTIQAIAVWQGPGSFTGLRIGLTVANTLAQDRGLPIVGVIHDGSSPDDGDNWIRTAIRRLDQGENDVAVMPEYGADANITKPRGS